MTTQTPDNTRRETIEAAEPAWLLVKRGLYWRPDSRGYTSFKAEAGRYSEDEARSRIRPDDYDGVAMIREDEAHDLAPGTDPAAKTAYELGLAAALASAEPQAREASEDGGFGPGARAGMSWPDEPRPAPAPPAETEGLVERLDNEAVAAILKMAGIVCVEPNGDASLVTTLREGGRLGTPSQDTLRAFDRAARLLASPTITAQLAARTQAPADVAEAVASDTPALDEWLKYDQAKRFKRAEQRQARLLASTGSRQEPAGEKPGELLARLLVEDGGAFYLNTADKTAVSVMGELDLDYIGNSFEAALRSQPASRGSGETMRENAEPTTREGRLFHALWQSAEDDLGTISHEDLCRLSQVFCEATGPTTGQDRRINEWLKERLIFAALPTSAS